MPIVEVDNLVKRYKGARTNAVDGLSFSSEPGEFFTIFQRPSLAESRPEADR
ncbi:MAG: hypothetical protein LC797_22650 [Chloroflexi bacterium]|nr:hypothetical protein [Chloroflexota bacterium]